jgi:hypothetical protein
MGSTRSSERFTQMPALPRLADVPFRENEPSASNDCFTREQTLANNSAMTVMRTKLAFNAMHQPILHYMKSSRIGMGDFL